jgi:hypothetical protein
LLPGLRTLTPLTTIALIPLTTNTLLIHLTLAMRLLLR